MTLTELLICIVAIAGIYFTGIMIILRMIDVYEKREAMAFLEWAGQEVNPFLRQENGKWVQACGNATEFTTEELYDLYLNRNAKPA